MPHRAVLVVVAWLCLTFVAAAQTLTFPALTGRVVDEAGLLDPTDRAALTASLADLEARTGDQIGHRYPEIAAGHSDRGLWLPAGATLGHRAKRTAIAACC
ncbi:MAG: hypothetical protein WDN04_01175 [Rhodospirillales bacterium]